MRRRALVLALLLAALLPLRLRAQAITAAPGGEMSSLVGMPFDVPIYVDMTARSDRLGSFAARIQWDTTVLRLSGASDGTFGRVFLNADSLVSGVARLAGANPAGAGGLITIAVVHFMPRVAQPDTIRFAVSELFAAGTFADLTPSLTVRNGYFCPARGRFGDIDKDGNVNSRDALIALSNAVGLDVSAFDIALGDVDANGLTNARDALIILSSAVGLNVSAYRVGRLAGGACAANLPLTMKIVPDSLTLVVGQTVAFEARALNGSGQLQTVTDAIWRTSNSAALGVFPDGKAVARDTGTVVVTAVRGALDSARTTVQIVARRTRHIVDAAAFAATNRLGTAALPFGTIGEAVAFAHDGDTVEVRPGRYAEAVNLGRPVVLMGDTLPDGTRPVVAPDSSFFDVGIALAGPGSREVHFLAIDGYYTGISLIGATQVLLRGVRTTGVRYGVSVDSGPVGSLRVVGSRLTGTGASYYGDGVSVYATVDTLVFQGTEIADFGYDGIYAQLVDSLAVRKSFIHDVGGYGINARGMALVVDSSRVLRARYGTVYASGAVRSATFSHNVLTNPGDNGVLIYGPGSGRVKFVGDSIESGYNWLTVENVDSLSFDSSWVRLPTYTYGWAYNVPLVRLTNSQFVDVANRVFEVYSYLRGSHTVIDNVSVVGNADCDGCVDAFGFYGPTATVNRLTAVNVWEGIYMYGDSALTVTNSLFRHVYYPIWWYGNNAVASSRLSVSNTTFQGFWYAIYGGGGAIVVDSNAFVNSSSLGIYRYSGTSARITRNRFTGVAYPITVYASSAGATYTDTIADNVIADLTYRGIYAYGADTAAVQVLRNSLSCNRVGANSGNGIYLSYARGVVANNQVTGCRSAIQAYDNSSPAKVDSIVANTVTMPASGSGIYVNGTVKARVLGNAVTGDTAGSSYYGGIYVQGYSGTGATALVSQNTVTGGTNYGIYASYLDTAVVSLNTVQNVAAPYYWAEGGIVFYGYLRYLARIYGNAVRHVTGNGIWTWNYNYNVTDTASVRVDSNLVVYSGGVGIQLGGGVDSVVHNRVTGSGIAAVQIYSPYYVDTVRTLVDSNNIAGNRFGLQAYGYAYHAPNNWWGRSQGPKCSAGCDTSSTVAGDSVSVGLLWTPRAPAEFGVTVTPPLTAPLVAALGSRPAALTAAAAASTDPLDAPLAPRARTVLTAPPRAPRIPAVERVPSGLSPARAATVAQRLERRVADAASLAEREAAQATARAARVAERAARLEQMQQQRAQADSALAAVAARQAAERAARETQRP